MNLESGVSFLDERLLRAFIMCSTLKASEIESISTPRKLRGNNKPSLLDANQIIVSHDLTLIARSPPVSPVNIYKCKRRSYDWALFFFRLNILPNPLSFSFTGGLSTLVGAVGGSEFFKKSARSLRP